MRDAAAVRFRGPRAGAQRVSPRGARGRTLLTLSRAASRPQDVLAEHAAYQGNFSKVAAECLAKCPAHNAKFTYNADKHTFNFIVHNGYSA